MGGLFYLELYLSKGLRWMRELACEYVEEEHYDQKEEQVQRPWGRTLIGKFKIHQESHCG